MTQKYDNTDQIYYINVLSIITTESKLQFNEMVLRYVQYITAIFTGYYNLRRDFCPRKGAVPAAKFGARVMMP